MIEDITGKLRDSLSPELQEAIRAFAKLDAFLGRATRSAAIGELSERIVAALTGATLTPRNTPGFDLVLDGRQIEVKGRLLSHYGDWLQFNFRRHAEAAQEFYCLAWDEDASTGLAVVGAYRLTAASLIELGATPGQPAYFARLYYRDLRRGARSFDTPADSIATAKESGMEEASEQLVDNTVQNLRQLLLELYVGSALWRDDFPDSEQVRLLDTVLAAGEGRPFVPLGLPFPKP